MGKQQYRKQILSEAHEDISFVRERLIHRQLQWLVFWTCVFLAAGALVEFQPGLEQQTIQAEEGAGIVAGATGWQTLRHP